MKNSRFESDFITIRVMKMDFVFFSMSLDYSVSTWLIIPHCLPSNKDFPFYFCSSIIAQKLCRPGYLESGEGQVLGLSDYGTQT